MKQFGLIALLGLAAVLLGLWVAFARPSVDTESDNPDEHADEVHYHAGFQIYLDDQLVDLTDLKFMSIKPCGPDDIHEGDEVIHQHNGVGDVIHIHAAGQTWGDVAEHINQIGELGIAEEQIGEMPIEAYVNGELVQDIFSYPVEPYDSVVVFVGNTTGKEEKLAGRVTKEHIEDVEASKEGCGLEN